ncbi:MAG: helix-turn-helix domain-containing protein [Candidatus Izimaplasma sp.]|nr:helix-turn-helix domain-containing protein [Candidatus Izimaplasma bacterium]
MKELLSPGEVASILDIHVKTVRRYLRDKTLKGIKVGGSWKISKEELEMLLKHSIKDNFDGAKKLIMKGDNKVMKSLSVGVKVANVKEGNKYAQALMKIINSNEYSKCKFKYDMDGKVARFIFSGSTDYLNAMMSKIDEIEQSI